MTVLARRPRMLYFCPEHAYYSRTHFLQRLAHALGKRWDLLYVDVDRIGWAARRHQPRTVADVAAIRHFSAVRLPAMRYRRVEAASAYAEAIQTLIHMALDRFRPDIVWCFSPRALPLVTALRHRVDAVVYWTGDEVVDRREPLLLDAATHVFALSEFAAAQKRTLTPPSKVHVLPMAVEPGPYTAAAARGQIPTDLAAIPPPRVGYAGMVNWRLNWPLVVRVAELRPRYSFVFIGPVGDSVAAARARQHPTNMYFLGHRDEPASFDYVAGLTVGIIPYGLSRFNLGSNPTKLYEYLAAGIPVVATPLPAVQRLSPPVHLATEPAEFAHAIDLAVSTAGSESLVASSRAIAHDHRYEHLVDRASAILGYGSTLPTRPGP